MRIALCDDEPQETEQLSRMIEDYALKRNYDIRCDRFAEGRALLREDRYDLYFLYFNTTVIFFRCIYLEIIFITTNLFKLQIGRASYRERV